jgi:hypothetical protein
MNLFCNHDYAFVRNIYGDEINLTNGRSWWKCEKCGQFKIEERLKRHRFTVIDGKPYVLWECTGNWRTYIGRDKKVIMINYALNPPLIERYP